MYRGIIQDDHFMTDELREQVFQRGLEGPIGLGRIWRVRHTGGSAGREFPDLGSAGGAELVTALQHPNGWVRDTAQRLLLDRVGDHAPALADIAAGEDSIAALHAIWTLEGRGELERDLVMELVTSGDPHRQLQALRAGRGQLGAADMLALHQALEDAPEPLAMQLAFALGDHSGDPAVRSALGAITTAQLASPYVRQAVVRAVSGQELAFLEEYFDTGQPDQASAPAKALLKALAESAYRSLRQDLIDPHSANPELLELLALIESRGDIAWQQVALLQGVQRVSRTKGFVPAHLDGPPPIFADGSIGEDSPLWTARLAARVAFTWPGDEIALGIKPLSPSQLAAVAQGEAFYPACAACHGESGEGIAGLAPPLAGAEWVTGPPEWLARIILQGMTGPVEAAGQSFDGVMPPHGHLAELDDMTLAGLMTYMRRSWGNKANPVSVQTVSAIRADSADREQPWTAPELKAVPYDRGFKRFEGKFGVSFVTFTVTAKPDGLHLSVPMYGSGIMDELTPTTFRAAAGGEDVEIEFVVEEGGAVNSLILHRKGEEIRVERKE